ncbi:uncharacterized protein LOC105446047 [Strongylocentrotus purpuratus]|uniref:Uncharacterized protein n=1 Tax=Strongylocentrotus purpuratus TaxID=7668 RepID=A0A7M7NK38_STRPU|nr:uncharacterized protein LOC105446047 [Strongylocentrotus purpuratus]
MEITTVDIGQDSTFPGGETNFVTASHDPYSLEVDEEQGFLYWSNTNGKILRKPLNGSGITQTVYSNGNLTKITGLSIDLSRDPRRIFFCDYREERTFYKDVHTKAHELTEYMSSDPNMRDISYFNGTLYWAKYDKPSAIAVMTEYDQNSPSFDIKETSEIEQPNQLLIIYGNP